MAKALLFFDIVKEFDDIQDVLTQNEHEFLISSNPKGALLLLESETDIDLIIVGSSVRNHSICESFLKHLKQNPRYKFIPIIIISSSTDKRFILKFAKLGVKNIVIMPFKSETINDKIKQALADGRRTVLIVDDEKEILNILRYVVELERFKVLTASCGEEALTILAEQNVHAIISDIMLPDKSGLELLAKVKADYAQIPVILITGHGRQFTAKKAFELGADDFFSKPFKNVEIIASLRRLIDIKRVKEIA